MFKRFRNALLGAFLLAGLLTSHPKAQGFCPIQLGGPATFCETFDTAQNGGTRSGDLNSITWGASRTSGNNSFGQVSDDWAPVHLQMCDGSTPVVMSPSDIRICNGQVREASNDNVAGTNEAGTVTTLAMYPKQPFDFAGRTGTIAFDVSNDTHGTHAAWPEFWITDTPAPSPFVHFDSWQSAPANSLGVRFGSNAAPGEQGYCQNMDNGDKLRWTVDSIIVSRNYSVEDTAWNPSTLHLTPLACVVAPAPGTFALNHVEIRVSQSQVDVYATDAGTTAPLKHIAVGTGLNLQFTRGLIWIEDTHYNADKGLLPSQREHTFAWDNVAFDGPFTYNDLGYDALDALTPGPNGSANLGKMSFPDSTVDWNVLNVPDDITATAVRVLFNFFNCGNATSLIVNVNGHPHPTAWPYPNTSNCGFKTFTIFIPQSDMITGTNVVQVGAVGQALISANVSTVFVNAQRGQGQPPVVTSATTASGVTGTAMSYQITATNTPTSFNASSLPPGLTVNTSTGLISGTPTQAGTFSSTVSATNSRGTGTATVTFTITAPPPTCQSVVRVNGVIMYIDQASSFCNGAHS